MRLLECLRRYKRMDAIDTVVDTISPLFNSNCKIPTTLMELSERDYNHVKYNCISVSGINITDNIVSGGKITCYS